MKSPSKSFTVEVRRSRASSPVARPNESKAPLFIEPKPALSQVSPSQARQLAERMFTSLTARSGAEPETKLTAESVFGAGTPRAAMEERPVTAMVAMPAAPPLSSVEDVEDMVQAKPRRPRVGKVRPSIVPSTKVVKSKASAAITTTLHIAPTHPESKPRNKVSKASMAPVKFDQVNAASPVAEAKLRGRQNSEWAPGERWKRRLRHLR